MKEKCQCTLRLRLVGDGCQYCNPEYANQARRVKKYSRQQLEPANKKLDN